ncbi:MAG: archease [Gallionellaceae bacterium]|nr:archease [Gallionellaceae bacterium]
MFAPYHYFDHEAGIGIEARGKTVTEAFENAASAMFAVMTHPSLILPERMVRVEFDAADPELALVEWLNRLLGQARLAGLVLGSFDLKREGDHYTGAAWGMHWKKGAERSTELKGASLTGLKVAQEGKRWQVRCVVDV